VGSKKAAGAGDISSGGPSPEKRDPGTPWDSQIKKKEQPISTSRDMNTVRIIGTVAGVSTWKFR